MKLKLIAPLLLCLLAAPAFAHPQHDDETPLPLKPEVSKSAPPAASTPKPKHAHKPAAKKAEPAPAAEAAPAAPKQP